jgi:monoamine oxidase
MSGAEVEVVVVGGGAAGIAAARTLHDAGVEVILVEARPRLGGRAYAVQTSGYALDLGCGWLHSAERNPWRAIAEAQGRSIDRAPPPWARLAPQPGFPLADQAAFRDKLFAFRDRVEAIDQAAADRPASDFLEPRGRWNELINAVSTFYSGAELDRISAVDYARYDDDGVNWRVVEGYGRVVVDLAAGVPVKLGCPVRRIDHRGRRLRVETDQGPLIADRAIITLPSNLIAANASLFLPALPDKAEAALGLPLGLADKLFLSLSQPDEFETDSRMFGRTDQHQTASYHFRPFGRPMIEAYFGGTLAARLEAEGEAAFHQFTVGELVDLLGADFARRVKPLQMHRWGVDPFARGSYSYAFPGKADRRQVLAEPVDHRLFFAGEACSLHDFSTAHGAYLTGIAAANTILDERRKRSVAQPRSR